MREKLPAIKLNSMFTNIVRVCDKDLTTTKNIPNLITKTCTMHLQTASSPKNLTSPTTNDNREAKESHKEMRTNRTKTTHNATDISRKKCQTLLEKLLGQMHNRSDMQQQKLHTRVGRGRKREEGRKEGREGGRERGREGEREGEREEDG